jgi:hypothetical protein
METNQHVAARPARRVRLIEHRGVVVAYPEPHRTPVLPTGWAPLTRDQQDAVLRACEGAPDCVIFTLGSVWEPGCEYRVYRLANDHWGGLAVVCKVVGADGHRIPQTRQSSSGGPCAAQLLGLAADPLSALRIATDFFNWDLEAHGQNWRLAVEDTSA